MSAVSPELRSLLDEIEERRRASVMSEARTWPRNQPVASDVDPDSCLRRQVLEIVDWENKRPVDQQLAERFSVGKLWESQGLSQLHALGFEVEAGQSAFELKNREGVPVLRGKIDGKVRWRARRFSFEIKSLRPEVYARIDSAEDMEEMSFSRKYPYQLQSYMLGHGEEEGFFMLTDCLGHWKPIPVAIDLAVCERIMQFAETIVLEVARVRKGGELPPYTDDANECRYCPFFKRSCDPPLAEIAAGVIADDATPMFKRLFELEEQADEYLGLEKKLKELAKQAHPSGDTLLRCGNYFAKIKEVAMKATERKAHTQRRVTLGVFSPKETD